MALEDLIKNDLANPIYSIALEKEFYSYFILLADNPWAMNFPACWQCFFRLKRYKPLFDEAQFRSDLMVQILKRGGWKRSTLRAIEKVMKECCGEEWKFFRKEFRKKKRKTLFQKPLKGDCKLQQAILISEMKKQFKRRAGGRVDFNDPKVADEFLERYFKETKMTANLIEKPCCTAKTRLKMSNYKL